VFIFDLFLKDEFIIVHPGSDDIEHMEEECSGERVSKAYMRSVLNREENYRV